MKNITILLTEGDHDAAFLYRILRANGFDKYSSLIKDFPNPLNSILASDIMGVPIPEINIQHAKTRFLPNNVVIEKGNIFLIYNIGGDKKAEARKKLISAFRSIYADNEEEIQPVQDTAMAILYFFDSDDKGIGYRLNQVNQELNEVFTGFQFENILGNGMTTVINNITFGAYVFVEEGSDKGKLEDVLIPMMREGNENIFESANAFLSIHEETNLFKGKVTYHEDRSIHKVINEKYDAKKSLIGTIGQLQKSGKSNTVCISDSDYLTEDKIISNETCNLIVQFIRKTIL